MAASDGLSAAWKTPNPIRAAAGVAAFPELRTAAAAMSKATPVAQPDLVVMQVYHAAFRAYQTTARTVTVPK